MRFVKIGVLTVVLAVVVAGSMLAISDQLHRSAAPAVAAESCGGGCAGHGGAAAGGCAMMKPAAKKDVTCAHAAKGGKCDKETCKECAAAKKPAAAPACHMSQSAAKTAAAPACHSQGATKTAAATPACRMSASRQKPAAEAEPAVAGKPVAEKRETAATPTRTRPDAGDD